MTENDPCMLCGAEHEAHLGLDVPCRLFVSGKPTPMQAVQEENEHLKSLLKDCYYNVSDWENPIGTRGKIEEVLGFTWTSRCPKCGAFGPCHWDDVRCKVVIEGEECGNSLIVVSVEPEGWDDE